MKFLLGALTGVAVLAGCWLYTSWPWESAQLTMLPVVERKLPSRLIVPSLNINATVESVGLAEGGAMANPEGPLGVAWFNLGPVPGEAGSAVIAGHFGWKNGKASVFDDLSTMKKGEEIYVENEKGEITVFVVREVKSYENSADALDVFVSQDGKAHLNLVTCAGDWNAKLKTYSSRVVVFADGV